MSQTTRRTQILRAAERLFGRYGPSKTTIADVAREADIAVGSVYLEFPSKDALIEELSASRHRAVIDAMRAAAEIDSRPFRDRLRAMLDARVEAFLRLAEGGDHACDLLHCKSEAVRAANARFRAEERALIADLIRAGARAGELDAQKPETVADTILSAYMSFSPPWLFASSRDELLGRLRAMHDLVLYGLVRRMPVERQRSS
jgi:AcrR family transcriptional regulator